MDSIMHLMDGGEQQNTDIVVLSTIFRHVNMLAALRTRVTSIGTIQSEKFGAKPVKCQIFT